MSSDATLPKAEGLAMEVGLTLVLLNQVLDGLLHEAVISALSSPMCSVTFMMMPPCE